MDKFHAVQAVLSLLKIEFCRGRFFSALQAQNRVDNISIIIGEGDIIAFRMAGGNTSGRRRFFADIAAASREDSRGFVPRRKFQQIGRFFFPFKAAFGSENPDG